MHRDLKTLGFDHLGLTIGDLKSAKDFFVQALGFQVVGENVNYPAVFLSDGHCTLTLWQAEDPELAIPFDRKRNIGLHHLAIKVPLEELKPLFEKMVAWPGVRIDREIQQGDSGDYFNFFIFIPEGPRLEFIGHINKVESIPKMP